MNSRPKRPSNSGYAKQAKALKHRMYVNNEPCALCGGEFL